MTQAFNLSQLANNLDSSGRLDATDGLVNAVPIANGGTGASSIAAAVSNLSQSIYPIGSIYINASVSTNPSVLLGFGTWSAFGAGRVPVGFNASNPLFDAAEETGGSYDSAVISHSHTATTSITDPGHRHRIAGNVGGGVAVLGLQSGSVAGIGAGSSGNYVDDYLGTPILENSTTGVTASTSVTATGSSGTNANIQPYITVFMWKRTA